MPAVIAVPITAQPEVAVTKNANIAKTTVNLFLFILLLIKIRTGAYLSGIRRGVSIVKNTGGFLCLDGSNFLQDILAP